MQRVAARRCPMHDATLFGVSSHRAHMLCSLACLKLWELPCHELRWVNSAHSPSPCLPTGHSSTFLPTADWPELLCSLSHWQFHGLGSCSLQPVKAGNRNEKGAGGAIRKAGCEKRCVVGCGRRWGGGTMLRSPPALSSGQPDAPLQAA